MAIAKVILNGETQMDVTQKTVTAGSMLSGTTALKNDGTDITGTIASKTSADLTASGATVTAPAGYYASAASKSVASGSAKTPNTTITANPTVSVNSSGLITATVSKTQSVTPSVSAGYVASGTAGTITVSGSGTNQLTTQAAQTIHPSTTDQTIASGKYLTGAQTVKAVTTTNLTAENIVSGVTVKVGDSTDDDCVASVTGKVHTSGYVATITRTGSYRYCRVTYDGVNFPHDSINTFLFSSGDVLEITSGARVGGAKIYIDGVLVANSGEDASVTYNYTLPANCINILMEEGNSSNVYVTTPTLAITENGTYNVGDYGKAEVNVPSGGEGGFVTGTLTVETTVQKSVDVKITDTTAIGFTPTKFLLLKDTDTKTNATIYSNTYTEQAGVATRTMSIYDGQGGHVVVSGSATSWTKPSSGFLRLLAGEIYINASSSYKLEAGTYTWYAIQ